jgi:hypothetical protein
LAVDDLFANADEFDASEQVVNDELAAARRPEW